MSPCHTSSMRKSVDTLITCLLAGVLLLSCSARPQVPSTSEEAPPSMPVGGLSGRLAISGSETMQPLLVRLAADFRKRYPDVKVGIEGGGSVSALSNFLEASAGTRRGDGGVIGHEGANQVLIMASSRKLSPQEVARFVSRNGYPPTAVPIAVDAVAIYVNRENPLQELTLDQVDAIFSRTRHRGHADTIERWGQLGLKDRWQEAPITLYGRDRNSGTRTFFKEYALQGGEFRVETTEMPGTASIVLAVSRNPLAIGYGGIGFLIPAVRPVGIAEKSGSPFVVPSSRSATDGSYPLHRFLYLYANKPPERPLQPVVREFLAFANSSHGQKLVAQLGFYPLNTEQMENNARLWTNTNGVTVNHLP